MIPVTKPFLPPQYEYREYIEKIWQRNWLTNNGPLVNDLELRLKNYLGVDHILYVTNGTVALQLAIRAFNLSGKIITTPFSYVATSTSIIWENCTPLFVDIDPHTLNIDPERIESAIDDDVSAILATHVYGNPCDVESIETLAKRHKLKVIFDAAHSFGVRLNSKSIFEFGDISCTSFHATKLFHTIEGGAVITKDPAIIKNISYLRNFGHDGPYKFNGIGINGKNSEFHAAMGLVNINYISDVLNKRIRDCRRYDNWLLKSNRVRKQVIHSDCEYNYAYYPVVFESEDVVLKIEQTLANNGIGSRRYFYPSLDTLYGGLKSEKQPVANDIAKRILCLPLFYQITNEEIDMVSRLILRVLNSKK